MSICTFFGHRDSPESLLEPLYRAITELVLQHGVTQFLVGNQGNFDRTALLALRQAAMQYEIEYTVVLPYLPIGPVNDCKPEETMLPECVQLCPRRFAIDRRNRWMLQQSEYVIAYIEHSWGGAAKYVDAAFKSGKKVVQLEKYTP